MKPACILVLFAMPLMSTPLFDLLDLGSLGGANASAYGLSPSGVAVGSATDAFGNMRAVTFAGGAQALASTAITAMAWDVNGAGVIAGAEYHDGESYATRWINGGSQTMGGAGSYATGINELFAVGIRRRVR